MLEKLFTYLKETFSFEDEKPLIRMYFEFNKDYENNNFQEVKSRSKAPLPLDLREPLVKRNCIL